jgi:hypothetical protein
MQLTNSHQLKEQLKAQQKRIRLSGATEALSRPPRSPASPAKSPAPRCIQSFRSKRQADTSSRHANQQPMIGRPHS